MRNQPYLSKTDCKNLMAELDDWFEHHPYSMLLCREQNDYSLFMKTVSNVITETPAAALLDCLNNRGKIQSIELLLNDS